MLCERYANRTIDNSLSFNLTAAEKEADFLSPR